MPTTPQPSVTNAQIRLAKALLPLQEHRHQFWDRMLVQINGGVPAPGLKPAEFAAVRKYKEDYKDALEQQAMTDRASKAANNGYRRLLAAASSAIAWTNLSAQSVGIENRLKSLKSDIAGGADHLTVKNHSKMLHKVEQALKNNKPEKAMELLKSAEPNWLKRMIFRSDSRALVADLERIRQIVADHKQVTVAKEELAPRLKAAEKSYAGAIRSALKGISGRGDIKAFLSNPVVQNQALTDPALAFIIDFCQSQEDSKRKKFRGGLVKGGFSNKEIIARLEASGGAINLQTMAQSMQNVRVKLAPDLLAARHVTKAAEAKYSNIKNFTERCARRQKFEDGITGAVGSVSAQDLLHAVISDPSMTQKQAQEILDRVDTRQHKWVNTAQQNDYISHLSSLISTGEYVSGTKRPTADDKFISRVNAITEATLHHGPKAAFATAAAGRQAAVGTAVLVRDATVATYTAGKKFYNWVKTI